MRVLVCGGRDYGHTDTDQYAEIYFAIRDLHSQTPITAVIHGGSRGADSCAAEAAKHLGIKAVRVPALWEVYGRRAGPIRNQRMIDDFKPDLVLAFPGGRGTADMVARAAAAGIPVRHPVTESVQTVNGDAMKQNALIGKTLTGMKLAGDRQAILFQTTEGDMVVGVDAGCCSYTWVEHIELPALGFPALVTAVDDLDLPQDAKPSTFHPPEESDSLAFYGCKISTDRGDIVIDYRNDSNGYYGGSLSWPGDHFYGGVFGQNVSKQQWQDIA